MGIVPSDTTYDGLFLTKLAALKDALLSVVDDDEVSVFAADVRCLRICVKYEFDLK